MPTTQRTRPLIAVVGSVDTGREFTPPLRAADRARDACRALGRELARAHCDLAVFSSKPKYVEADVVAGYADASHAGSPGRVAAYPPRHKDVDFALPEGAHVTVETLRDTSGEWEVSYYRTLLDCDGVLLVGGGQSTRVAGIIALSQRIPLLPVAAFGGGAGQVWVNLDKVRNDTDDADIALLGDNWSPDAAPRLVECLLRQRERARRAAADLERVERSRARRAGTGLAVAAVCLLAAVAALVTAGGPGPATARGLAVLLAAPLLAAVSGALIRHSFETAAGWSRAAVRGLGAGLVSVLLYVASQLLTVPALLDDLDVRRLLFFTVPLGFSAGFTFDLVFERLRAGAVAGPPGVDPLAGGASAAPADPVTPPAPSR
ncbi:hypothetical protein V1J52_18055 [Streptomyces sp. TRM 70351]|uniref:hypothetical protein n=1 Tax=Streptomyces sp. TRM 70351 TaxID=3116552 RepID=UPI002E7BABA0|nr:hypothetical protein [Streptomyces sp. TRM 70351]MEE1930065.1 hypothetical protein [Streptomyces sp. TRM 70351]